MISRNRAIGAAARFIFLLCLILTASAVLCASTLSTADAAVPGKKKAKRLVLRKAPRAVTRSYTPRPVITTPRIPAPVISQPVIQGEPELTFNPSGFPVLDNLDVLGMIQESRSFAVDKDGNRVNFTLSPGLQLKARSLLQQYSVPWGSIVALEPKTGRVIALASYSSVEPGGPDVATRASFPAASLFKLITAAAAIERAGLNGEHTIYFRGGNYTLERGNYLPDAQRDRRQISFADALGRSINPAFGRVGLNYLSKDILEKYALNFGFNREIPFDAPVDVSQFRRPVDDYETARTAAGFGEVTVSPLHAALLTAAIANNGLMMRPYLIESVTSSDGAVRYRAQRTPMRTAIMSSTSRELLSMMQSTTEIGTARKQFLKVRSPFLKSASIAAKTGTLKGDNPKGTYHWFVAAVPAENPEIAIATLVIDPGTARVKSAALAKEALEYYFQNKSPTVETRSETQRDARS